MSRHLCNPFDPVNIAKREKAIAATGNAPVFKKWIQDLLDRREAGEILEQSQIDRLRQAGAL